MPCQPRPDATPCRRLALVSLLVFSATCSAQDSGLYAGASGGWADTDIKRDRIAANLQNNGYTVDEFASDDRENAYKLVGGYRFNDFFGVEAAYFDLGKLNYSANLMPSATQSGTANVDGFGLDLVGTLPLQNDFSLIFRAGINKAKVKQFYPDNIAAAGYGNRSDRSVHEKYGAGIQYRATDELVLRAELERYRIENSPVIDHFVDTLMVGFVYRFGPRRQAQAATERPQPTPQPAARPATPEPTPAPPVEITLSANTLFDFDRAVLRPAGKTALDDLVRDMAGLDYDVVIVTGHTDRIGTRSYNLGLSMRRATTVRDYLVQAGVPDNRITATGVNSDEPVTRPGQCTGPVSDALKACLQPDRRVVVEVTGIREE